ncbi:MAG: RMD1 family protein, partial [Hyphomicrobiales bacterium]|nr:RMD1 family protein [Hyphomicrobiales bacterium]
NGRVAVYRFGVVVLAGLTTDEESEILSSLGSRVSDSPDKATDEDTIAVNVGGGDDKVSSGVVNVQKFGDERFIVIADTLAKSVGLTRNERSVNAVFEAVEPLAADMASLGR